MKTYIVYVKYNNNKLGRVEIVAFNPMDAHITAYNIYSIKSAYVDSEINVETKKTIPVKY